MLKLLPVCLIFLVLSACGELYAENPTNIIRGEDGHKYYTGLIQKPEALKTLGQTYVTLEDCDNLPEEFDLRDLGVVPPVKDQGNCGSCWAFSKTASLESALGGKFDLSEQQLVSCDNNNYGCSGGLLNNNEFQVVNGQTDEASFPYKAKDVACKSGLKSIAKAQEFVYVGDPDRKPAEKDLMCAIYKSKTIPWITVGANSGWTYVPNDPDFLMQDCSYSPVNHAVGIVGWRTVEGKVYFKMRNSWGIKWGNSAGRSGEGGYLMMPIGCDNLGEEAAYIVGNLSCKPPKASLPVQIWGKRGDKGTLKIAKQKDTTYKWYFRRKFVGNSNVYNFTADYEGTIRVIAKNACGKTTVRTQLKILRD